MTMTEQRRKDISFFENYGMARMLGATVDSALSITNAHPEESVRLYAALLVARNAQASVGERISAYADLASAIPIAGRVLALAGGLLGTFADWLNGVSRNSCSKTSCSLERSRNVIGILPGSLAPPGDKILPFTFHDGLVVQGPGTAGTPDQFGRKKGAGPLFDLANGRNSASRSYNNVTLRANPFYGLGDSLPRGDWDKPWDTPNTYYWRAWRVRKIMLWAMLKVPCPVLSCLWTLAESTLYAPEEVFANQPGGWWESRGNIPGIDPKKAWALQSPAADLTRRKGSRWYASLYRLHKDVGERAIALPMEDVQAACAGIGDSQRFLEAVGLLHSGYPLPAYEQPWPWWYATRWLSFRGMLELLPRLEAANRGVTPKVLHPTAQRILSYGRVQRVVPQQQQQYGSSESGLGLPLLLGVGALGALLLLGGKK